MGFEDFPTDFGTNSDFFRGLFYALVDFHDVNLVMDNIFLTPAVVVN
jgi:hypothetical protein